LAEELDVIRDSEIGAARDADNGDEAVESVRDAGSGDSDALANGGDGDDELTSVADSRVTDGKRDEG
jgi:hypothetical protein